MSNPNRKQCPRCYYASDTETVCPAICCRGTAMVPAPDALLDDEIFTAESWQNQCEATMRGRFEKANAPKPRPVSSLHAHDQAAKKNSGLDTERAARLREWE